MHIQHHRAAASLFPKTRGYIHTHFSSCSLGILLSSDSGNIMPCPKGPPCCVSPLSITHRTGKQQDSQQANTGSLLVFNSKAPAPFVPKVRICLFRAMISPGCFCLGSGNDPLKKQLAQHLGKKEEVSVECKIRERNSFTPLTCRGIVQTPVYAPLPSQRAQLSSPALLPPKDGIAALWGRQGMGCAVRRLGKQGSWVNKLI